jgi:Predicted glycosyltransferases
METNPYRRPCTVDILIRGYGNLKLTWALIDSILAYTGGVDYQVIYVDNGSEDLDGYHQLVDTFSDHKNVTLCRLPFNHGSVRAINVGLNLADCSEAPYVLLLDNDTEIPQGDKWWLSRFIGYLDDPEVGAAGAATNFPSGNQYVDVIPDRYQKEWEGHIAKPEDLSVLVSFAMLLRKEAIHKVGLFDERFEPGNCEDVDYTLRLHQAGYKCVVAESVYIHHKVHATFGPMGLSDLMAINGGKLVDKWTVPVLNEYGIQVRLRQSEEIE